MVENENSSNQGQILSSCNVKTFTTVENEAISDWLKATDEENFSERNSVLDSEELDSGISSMSSGYESSDSGEERRELVVKKDKGIQVCEILKKEVDETLEADEKVLESNEELRTALREQMARNKKVKMKYNAAEKELRTAEVTVKNITSIECDLRELLKHKEEQLKEDKF